MKIELQPTPKSDGCISVMTEPDATDPNIEFWRDGQLVVTAFRNGHHVKWESHTKTYVLYYYGCKSANIKLRDRLTAAELSGKEQMNNQDQSTGSVKADSPPATGSGVFSECRDACRYHVLTPNGGGGHQHDCAHPENSSHLPTDQTPCDPRVCPIFTSDDEDGDYEHCRYEHEIEGKWYLPKEKGEA